ncbi:MAG: hypothetical protein LUH23_09190 [Oscillospiraceae bacterium]|nr:hypothetical protein [Oscillospiraceae bacterium]
MRETTKKPGTLALVSEHQTTGWKLGSGYDIDFQEYTIVADDLRALAGRAGYAQAGRANKLCRELMPLAAKRLDFLGKQIVFWEQKIRETEGNDKLEAMKKHELDHHNVYVPTADEPKNAARALRLYAKDYPERMLIDEIFEGDFAERLEDIMNQCANIMDLSIDWVTDLIRHVCEEDDDDEAL